MAGLFNLGAEVERDEKGNKRYIPTLEITSEKNPEKAIVFRANIYFLNQEDVREFSLHLGDIFGKLTDKVIFPRDGSLPQ